MSYYANKFSGLAALGAVTISMDPTTVHGSDGWAFNVKAAYDSELNTEIQHQAFSPLFSASQILNMMVGLADADYRAKHGTPNNVLSDFGAFANTGAFVAYYTPYAQQWYSAKVGQITPAPVVTEFSAVPASIVKGKTSTLYWNVSGSLTSLSIDQGLGAVGASGSRQVIPSISTTYTITARGTGGTVTKSATVTVTEPTTGGGSGGGGTDTGGTGGGGGGDGTTPPPATTGSNTTMYLMLGGAALVLLMLMKR